MKKEEFWKNFNLGVELDIAGRFIYNGLKTFDCMEHFYFEGEIFEFLYNISVGIERLEKICIILIEHKEIANQEEFEKSLITHSHQDLLRRISMKYNLGIINIHNAFIQLLTEFYKTWRYDRYILQEAFSFDKERVALVSFIEKYLNIKIDYKGMFTVTVNDDRIKKFLGKIIGKICSELYNVIDREASSQGIYTYEIQYNSKAFKIFTRKEYDFTNENVLLKEILVFLLNNNERSPLLEFIKQIEPLDFDIALIQDYINCLKSDLNKLWCMDEIDTKYEEIEDKGERIGMLDVIGNKSIIFDSDDYEDEL